MDVDLGAQLPEAQQSDFIKLYRQLISTYDNVDIWRLGVWLDFSTYFHRKILARKVTRKLRDIVQQEWDTYKRGESKKSRSVLTLSFSGIDVLDSTLSTQITDQLKTFLFAGHDTTSILLQWAFYELSRTPAALKSLRAELNEVFGPSADAKTVREMMLSKGEEIMRRLTYTSAVIKETLRLYPPASSGRRAQPGTGLILKTPDCGEILVDELLLYVSHRLIQRNENAYGPTKDDFLPERWLGNTDTSMATNSGLDINEKMDATAPRGESGIPATAWRTFERGPRNCIGQELANIEARVILACVVRKFDFEKVGLGELELGENGVPVLTEKGTYKAKSELYNVSDARHLIQPFSRD
jgi:cytochrome P450